MKVQEILKGKVIINSSSAVDVILENGARYQIVERHDGLQIVKLEGVTGDFSNMGMVIINTHALNVK